MHLELEPHPHPHPHPHPRRGILPWLLIAGIMGLAAFLALKGGGCASVSDGDVLKEFHEGVGILEKYEYAGAFKKFDRVTQARPQWAAAHFNKGLAALNEQRLPVAEAALKEALRLDPASLHARYCLGILYGHTERFDEAFLAFEAVAKADPGDPHALYEYGAALASRQRFPEAKEALLAAVRIQPAFASAIYRLMFVHRNLRELEGLEAMAALFKELDQKSEGIKTGIKYSEGGKYYLAIRDPRLPSSALAPQWNGTAAGGPSVAPGASGGSSSGASAKAGTVISETVASETVPSAAGPPRPIGAAAPERARPDGTPAPPAFALGDLDGDGELDLLLCGQPGPDGPRAEVWKGGPGGFQKGARLPGDGIAAGVGDLDGDRDLDVVLAVEGGVAAFDNGGKGDFSPSKLRFPDPGPGFPVKALIFDADADWDLDVLLVRQLKAGERLETSLALLNNNRDGSFENVAERVGIARLPWPAREALFADLDGDIDADLLFFFPDDALVLVNDRSWRYRHVAAREFARLDPKAPELLARLGLEPRVLQAIRGGGKPTSATRFLDGAGKPQLLTAEPAAPVQIAALEPAPRSWIAFDLNGPENPVIGTEWANLSGVGATVEVRAGALIAVQQAIGAGAGGARGACRVEFDLQGAQSIDYVRILWPDGVLQAELGLAANKVHRIKEIQRKPSSCPIVFVWDGSRFRYAADLLGVGGLGYLEAPGVFSRPDPTEVLELAALAPAVGEGGAEELQIRILEPLEECTYLDAVELVAADAPEGVTVHPEEMFAVRAPAPGARLLAYTRAIPPARAEDGKGRDIAGELRDIDRLYPEGWSRDRRFPGAAEEHSIVLGWDHDLLAGGVTAAAGARPDAAGALADAAARPVLFLYGYVEYGYSTSNFAAAQARVTLRAPTLSVERGGAWKPLREEWGFPGGTPRWMAVDLAGLLGPGDRRLRVDTTMEIYWDQAFLAQASPIELGEIGHPRAQRASRTAASVATAAGEVRVTVLAPDRADLRYRGFPRDRSTDGRHPKLYDYDDLDTTLVLKPFPGRYTPYGDARSLVTTADDRLAVFGEGDELDLGFRAARLPPLPAGWRRTFFLGAVGYCKDMDLYTAASDRVEPLPHRNLSAYPPPQGEELPEAGRLGDRPPRTVAPLALGQEP